MTSTAELQTNPNGTGGSSPESARDVSIGEGMHGEVWDKIGAKVDLAGEVADDPMRLPFFIQTERKQPDGTLIPGDMYMVANDVVIDLARTAQGKPDTMSLERAFEIGLLSPQLEIGKEGGKAGIIDSVVRWQGAGYGDEDTEVPNDAKYATYVDDIQNTIFEHTNMSWDEFVNDRASRIHPPEAHGGSSEGAKDSEEKESPEQELSEVAKANIEALRGTELGPQLIPFYKEMLLRHPDLANVSINIVGEDDPKNWNAHWYDANTEESNLRLRMDRAMYEEWEQSERMELRLVRLTQFLREENTPLNTELLALMTMLHEFGHANDYKTARERMSGLSARDFRKTYGEESKADYKSLPFKGKSSNTVLNRFQRGDEAEQAKILQWAGVSDFHQLQAMAEENDRGYGLLPQEKAADDFAIGMLRLFIKQKRL